MNVRLVKHRAAIDMRFLTAVDYTSTLTRVEVASTLIASVILASHSNSATTSSSRKGISHGGKPRIRSTHVHSVCSG